MDVGHLEVKLLHSVKETSHSFTEGRALTPEFLAVELTVGDQTKRTSAGHASTLQCIWDELFKFDIAVKRLRDAGGSLVAQQSLLIRLWRGRDPATATSLGSTSLQLQTLKYAFPRDETVHIEGFGKLYILLQATNFGIKPPPPPTSPLSREFDHAGSPIHPINRLNSPYGSHNETSMLQPPLPTLPFESPVGRASPIMHRGDSPFDGSPLSHSGHFGEEHPQQKLSTPPPRAASPIRSHPSGPLPHSHSHSWDRSRPPDGAPPPDGHDPSSLYWQDHSTAARNGAHYRDQGPSFRDAPVPPPQDTYRLRISLEREQIVSVLDLEDSNRRRIRELEEAERRIFTRTADWIRVAQESRYNDEASAKVAEDLYRLRVENAKLQHQVQTSKTKLNNARTSERAQAVQEASEVWMRERKMLVAELEALRDVTSDGHREVATLREALSVTEQRALRAEQGSVDSRVHKLANERGKEIERLQHRIHEEEGLRAGFEAQVKAMAEENEELRTRLLASTGRTAMASALSQSPRSSSPPMWNPPAPAPERKHRKKESRQRLYDPSPDRMMGSSEMAPPVPLRQYTHHHRYPVSPFDGAPPKKPERRERRGRGGNPGPEMGSSTLSSSEASSSVAYSSPQTQSTMTPRKTRFERPPSVRRTGSAPATNKSAAPQPPHQDLRGPSGDPSPLKLLVLSNLRDTLKPYYSRGKIEAMNFRLLMRVCEEKFYARYPSSSPQQRTLTPEQKQYIDKEVNKLVKYEQADLMALMREFAPGR